MNNEQKIFSLMAAAEKQQELTTEFINLHRSEIQTLQEERNKIIQEHHQVLNKIEARLSKKLNFTWIISSVIACLLSGLIIMGGAYLYVSYITDGLDESEASYSKLKGYNADFHMCPYKNKDYPCIRVMKSWGGFGEFGDIYIIDPK